MPSPHETVHAVHGAHALTTQSTGLIVGAGVTRSSAAASGGSGKTGTWGGKARQGCGSRRALACVTAQISFGTGTSVAGGARGAAVRYTTVTCGGRYEGIAAGISSTTWASRQSHLAQQRISATTRPIWKAPAGDGGAAQRIGSGSARSACLRRAAVGARLGPLAFLDVAADWRRPLRDDDNALAQRRLRLLRLRNDDNALALQNEWVLSEI